MNNINNYINVIMEDVLTDDIDDDVMFVITEMKNDLEEIINDIKDDMTVTELFKTVIQLVEAIQFSLVAHEVVNDKQSSKSISMLIVKEIYKDKLSGILDEDTERILFKHVLPAVIDFYIEQFLQD